MFILFKLRHLCIKFVSGISFMACFHFVKALILYKYVTAPSSYYSEITGCYNDSSKFVVNLISGIASNIYSIKCV